MINTDRRIFNLMGNIMDLGRVRQNLSDAGCAEEISGDIMKMCEDGNLDRALLTMKKARCTPTSMTAATGTGSL